MNKASGRPSGRRRCRLRQPAMLLLYSLGCSGCATAAVARPAEYRGTLVIVRARLTPSGLLDETRLVGSTREVELAPTQRLVQRQGPFASESRAQVIARQPENFDVRTGQRALLPVSYP